MTEPRTSADTISPQTTAIALPATLWVSLSRLANGLRRADRVWLTFAALFAALALLSPAQAVASARFTAGAFLGIAPFLLVSVVLAAWLQAAGADRLIGGSVARSPAAAIVIAALVGGLSPFCSCGVVPLVAAMLAAGMPLPAVMAFWIASPIMNPEQFVLLAATIGLGFAIAKAVAAVAMGALGGFATLALQRAGGFSQPLRQTRATGCGAKSCGSGTLAPVQVEWAVWRSTERRSAFATEARKTGLFLAKWLSLAFAIESLMVAWLPPDLIVSALGGGAWYAIPLAVLIGIPAYLNGFAAIPLVGGLIDMGMAPGAGMAFLTAGAVTSLPAAMAVFALVRRPVFLWYLTLALIGSLATGLGYQLLVVA